MKVFCFYCFLIFSVFTQVGIAHAEQFEVRGFRQGMTFKDVQNVAVKNGLIAEREVNLPNNINIRQSDGKVLLSLSLCNEGLFHASWIVDGGFERFIKLLDSLTRQEGLKKLGVTWRIDFGYNGKELYKLSVDFISPGSEKDYWVSATLFAVEEHGPTNSQVSWIAHDNFCNSK